MYHFITASNHIWYNNNYVHIPLERLSLLELHYTCTDYTDLNSQCYALSLTDCHYACLRTNATLVVYSFSQLHTRIQSSLYLCIHVYIGTTIAVLYTAGMKDA